MMHSLGQWMQGWHGVLDVGILRVVFKVSLEVPVVGIPRCHCLPHRRPTQLCCEGVRIYEISSNNKTILWNCIHPLVELHSMIHPLGRPEWVLRTFFEREVFRVPTWKYQHEVTWEAKENKEKNAILLSESMTIAMIKGKREYGKTVWLKANAG